MDISDNALDSEYECISSSESLLDTDFSEQSEDENQDSDATGPWIGQPPTDDEEPLDHPFVSPSDSDSDLDQEAAPVKTDNPEDQRVKEALDQSMVSTLSSSRSGSFGRSSMSSSRPSKDIRLSFPDPIASTTDDIRRSYEELDASATRRSRSRRNSHEDQVPAEAAPESESITDLCVSSTQELSPRDSIPSAILTATDLFIVLYGFSIGDKLDLVDRLLRSHSSGSGLELVDTIQVHPPCSQILAIRELRSPNQFRGIPPRVVTIIDKTQSLDFRSISGLSYDKPSLGIIFFPQRAFSVVPDHTYYLPLVASTSYTKDTPGGIDSVRSSAESNWKDLGVSHDKLLFNLPASPVVETETVMEYDPRMVSAAFKKLIPPLEPVKDHTTLCVEHSGRWGRFIARTYFSEPLVMHIFFGLMCALVGYIATGRTDIPVALVPASTAILTLPPNAGNPGSWAASDDGNSQPAISIAVPTSTVSSSILPAISSNLGLTIFNPPGSLSVVDSPPLQAPQPSTPDSASSPSSSTPSAEHRNKNLNQDVISRPTNNALVISHDSEPSALAPSSATPTPKPDIKHHVKSSENSEKGKGRETVEDVLHDLSLQLASSVTSVSQALDMDFIRALAASFNREVSEIIAFLDQFVREIKSQGINFFEDPKNAMKKLKKKLTRGNRQAKKNAKTIVEVGERFFGMVRSGLEAAAAVTRETEQGEVKKSGKSTRGARAKERALKMHKKVFKSEEWLKHQRAIAERRAGPVQAH
ncbi:hypothetical protein BJ322DRAFT_1096384 [Thelephora terrestris]|uniref:Uncharacterized protein n=1 Tax=Thelephora terrestris TaxID=56493 RepID=A0A9P6L0R4_9AGAM|nr:hypothetical protein BJ322DRAFT_1096384 [Thelephora terrestris]